MFVVLCFLFFLISSDFLFHLLLQHLLFCHDCGEAFHSYCLIPGLLPNPARRSGPHQRWRCPNCVVCEQCCTRAPNAPPHVAADPIGAQLLVCEACDAGTVINAERERESQSDGTIFARMNHEARPRSLILCCFFAVRLSLGVHAASPHRAAAFLSLRALQRVS